MKHSFFKALFYGLFFFGIFSCNNDDDDTGFGPSSSVNDFIWTGLNHWYYWQASVSNLADDRFATESEYENFIESLSPDNLFYSLLYDYGNTDRFSWIVSDYHTLENQFASIKLSYGMDYGLVYESQNSNEIFGYVQYVLPNSPASTAGLQRGDIFTRINGTQLNDSNYTTLLSENAATFGLGYIQNGQLYESTDEVSMSKVELQENPIYLQTVFTIESHKIGYLVYNGFRANFNDELNDAIGQLKNQGITDFILDLRYNGGGSVQTSSYLGSMITGQFNQENFTNLTFNEKNSTQNSTYKFGTEGKIFNDELNQTGTFQLTHLNLNKLVVLTSHGTASASEMLISCLRPYIQVETIGTSTYGKTVGSITLYDSPSTSYTSTNNINPNHTWAMQPIVFDYRNANNESSPVQGISPLTEINEIQYLENLPALGNSQEPLLATAIDRIVNGGFSPKSPTTNLPFSIFKTNNQLKSFGTEMYLDKGISIYP